MEKQIVDFTETGKFIRKAREMQGMTAIQLCDQIERCTGRKINEHALMRIERGQEPKVSVLLDICATLFPGHSETESPLEYAFFNLTVCGMSNAKEVIELGNARAKAETAKKAAIAEAVANEPEWIRDVFYSPNKNSIESVLQGIELPSTTIPKEYMTEVESMLPKF